MDKPLRKRCILYINGDFISSDFSTEYTPSTYDDVLHIKTNEKVKLSIYRDNDGVVKESLKIVRDELLKHGYLYDSFLASIMSAENNTIRKETAEKILKRIVGEE